MSRLAKLFRLFLVWWLPTMLLLVALVGGLAFWTMASERGTRLLLTTLASQFDGSAENIQGTLLGGVRAGHFALVLPGVAVEVDDLNVSVDWKALAGSRIHVTELSAGSLRIALTTQPDADDAPEGPATDLVLPVEVAVDKLVVDHFSLTQDGEPLPVELSNLQATLAASASGAQLRVATLHVGHPMVQADIEADVVLDKLADPWPLRATVIAAAHGQPPDSPLCLDRVWAQTAAKKTSPKTGSPDAAKIESTAKTASPAAASAASASSAAACTVVLNAQLDGSLEAMKVVLDGQGSGVALKAHADLTPRGLFPLRTAHADLLLPDGSGLTADLNWQSTPDGARVRDRLAGTLDVRRLDVGRLAGDAIPPALVTLKAGFDVALIDQHILESAGIDLAVAPESRWNRQPLSGHVRAQILSDNQTPDDPLASLRIEKLDIDLSVARDRLRAQGSLGQSASAITLDFAAPVLAALWPDVAGGATLKGKLGGTVAAHQGELTATYAPAKPRAGVLGEAPADVVLKFKGGWGLGQETGPAARLAGWRGQLSSVRASHAGFGIDLAREVPLSFLPDAVEPLWQWQVGAASVVVLLPGNQRMTLDHRGSRGGSGRWETAGRIDNAVINRQLVRGVMSALDPEAVKRKDAERARVNARAPEAARQIAVDASWDVKFAGTLSGQARIARRAGDLLIPGDPPVPVGLRDLSIDVVAKPITARSSRIDATLKAATAKMGTIDGTGQAVVVVDANGAMGLDPRQPVRARLNADIADLSWVGLFTGDAIEVGGAVNASVDVSGVVGGKWQSNGTVRATGLKLVQIDNGIRLFDGTLSARLAENTFIIDSLRFPASLRVLPTEWRTKTWITEEPDAKNGYIEAKGQWGLLDSTGKIRIDVRRFPILQRSDRFAMVSGVVDIDAALPRITITGDIKADAGWVSLEILQSVPTLDDDVRIRRPGDEDKIDVPLQVSMNLKFDMGPRFYITGMGLNAGIVGNIQILLRDGRLSGAGALHTRGGRIEAYGQGLQLRRGTVTFQGALDNPVLDIEALRTNQQVQAGVQVTGTAQRPRIELVSYPDVSDVEKLSWLILGRGPDDSGGEAALLLSAGAALLTGDEPFYRKFGLDDVSVRSGAIGSSGSILPDRTVASNVNRTSDDLATQFVVASKSFANGIKLSLEQSMSGSGTVARLSYQLRRGLSIDLKGGTITGLSLVYQTFFQ